MKALLALVFLIPILATAQTDSASTQGGRIVVQGGNSKLRGAIVTDAEALTKSLSDLVGEPDGTPYPIILELRPAAKGKPSAIVPSFLHVPETPLQRYLLKLEMRLGQGGSFDQPALERELLEMLLIERSLRALPPEETTNRVEIRPWLLDGLGEALVWKSGRGDRRIYASLVDSGGWMAAEKLVETVNTAKMNVLSRELFRASSGALVMALLAQPQGNEAMSTYLGKVAVFEGEQLTLLRSNFPQVNLGKEGLERWWMLQVAAMSEANLTEQMTIPETEAVLDKVLKLYFKSKTGRTIERGLEAWPEIAKLETLEERSEIVRPATDLLTYLSFRCFPTYRPVLGGYLQAFNDLAETKTEGVAEVFENLRVYREAEQKRYETMIDLLDWYHISTVQTESGEFEGYLKFKRNIEGSSVKMDDPFNRYLDNVQKIFDRKK